MYNIFMAYYSQVFIIKNLETILGDWMATSKMNNNFNVLHGIINRTINSQFKERATNTFLSSSFV